jgi:predicted HTH domain antitoxin
MKTLTINIPDSLEIDSREAKLLLASRLYEKGKLSLGQATEMVELSKRAFMEILADDDVSIFNYPADEIDNDFENVKCSGVT